MSNLINHAKREFQAMGWDSSDEMQNAICENVIELLKVFSEQGHSGTSAPYAIELFTKLASYEPLCPLTGNDDEWNLMCDDRTNNVVVYQNNGCSHVFKQSDRFDGKPYDIDAIHFWEWYSSPDIDDGKPYKCYFTSSDSFATIEFPYTPKTIIQFRPTDEFPNEVL